ncbi:MAG: hypothetical protein GX790_00450 [Syntrophomonadaceae bacterium]|nr:hypothetical protein [Syntrophomonadaceae bacterium]
MKLRIKYCGGCNPNINRTKLVKEVLDRLKDKTNVEVVNDKADVGLIVGGCSVCCVNLSEIEDQAAIWVVVGGNLVDYYQVSSDQLPDAVTKKICEKANLSS